MNGRETDGGTRLARTGGSGTDWGEAVDKGEVGAGDDLVDAGTSDDLGIGGDLADGPGGRELK